MSVSRSRTLIVGGGVLGCLTAYYLARAGWSDGLTILERGEVGLEASGTNAGTLAVSNKEVRLARLASQCVADWAALSRELGPELGYVRSGGLRVAATDQEAEKLAEVGRRQNELGLEVRTLTGRAMRDFAPYLGDRVRMANFCAFDGYGDPLRATSVLARAIRERGVRIETGTRFLGLERGPQGWLARTDRGDRTADRVLLAMGAWNAGFLLSAFGLRTPAQLRVNQLMVSEPVEAFVPHVVTNVSETLTLKQLPAGTFVIGGGWQGLQDFGHGRTWPARESMAGNARAAVTLIPALRELNIVRAWARFDVKTPDKLPLVGRVAGQEDLFVAGTGHAGLTFGPAAARAAAGLIAGQLDETEIAAWRPDRPAVVISEHAPAAAPAGAAAGEG